ncbi:hypothetical protein GIW81_02115 [Hyphomicrobium sp. xq]|uniref:Uncharacterized protein n=1 Tax=Hyphomicrobium album TaxID=2665159 RepID=A0A6I3KCG4_9HYPH|nr:hypothetical protein [Hyphomicrobium album]MTD93125.1 hypothetical protein [Hyphomicrobium album]
MLTEALMKEFATLVPARLEAIDRESVVLVGTRAHKRARVEVAACDERMLKIARSIPVDGTLESVLALRNVVAEFHDYGRQGCLTEQAQTPDDEMLAKLLGALYELEKKRQ